MNRCLRNTLINRGFGSKLCLLAGVKHKTCMPQLDSGDFPAGKATKPRAFEPQKPPTKLPREKKKRKEEEGPIFQFALLINSL